jgi:hypothetical protein
VAFAAMRAWRRRKPGPWASVLNNCAKRSGVAGSATSLHLEARLIGQPLLNPLLACRNGCDDIDSLPRSNQSRPGP